jgi:hypothetical protein
LNRYWPRLTGERPAFQLRLTGDDEFRARARSVPLRWDGALSASEAPWSWAVRPVIEFINDQGFKQLTKWRCSIKDGTVRRAARHAQFLTSAAVEIVMGTAACFYGVRG